MENLIAIGRQKYQDLINAFREAPQDEGRFNGSDAERNSLVSQMRELFDGEAGENPLYLDRVEAEGLADDLGRATHSWSIGQYISALDSLLDHERL